MASFNPGFHFASSHTHTHFLDSSVNDGVHDDSYYDFTSAFIRMDIAQPGPGTSLGTRAGYPSSDPGLQFEQELLNAHLALHSPSPSVSDDAAMQTYVPPASLSSTPSPEPFSEDTYNEWYPGTNTSHLQSSTDMHELSAMTSDLWMARGTIPVNSAYSTIADALVCCPADVFAPPPPPPPPSASTAALFQPAETSDRSTREAPQISRTRTSSRIHEQPARAPSSAPYPPSPATSSTSSRASYQEDFIPTTRRNAPAFPATQRLVASGEYKCPHCDYVQRNRRGPDFKRHVETHNAQHGDFVCCGVPLADAPGVGVPAAVMGSVPVVYEGIAMVGGCRRSFSRRDALGRHLRRYAGRCFGDAHAPYLLGNKGGA